MKRLAIVFFIILTATLLLAQANTTPSTPVAIINGQPITSDFLNVMADIKRILYSINTIDEKFFDVLVNTKEGLIFIQRYRYEVLKELVDEMLVQQFATKYGACPTDEEIKKHVEKQIDDSLQKLGITLKDFERYLGDIGMTLSDLKLKFSWIYKTNKCKENLKEQITKNVTVAEAEVKEYYEALKKQAENLVLKNVSIIVTNTKDDAKRALQMLLDGKDFSEVASILSVDKESAKNGGTIGYIDQVKAEELFGEEIAKKLMNATEGVILGPYQVGIHWIIFMVGDEKKQVEEFKSYDEIKEKLKKEILSKKREEYWKKWWDKNFSEFKEKSNIKIYLKF